MIEQERFMPLPGWLIVDLTIADAPESDDTLIVATTSVTTARSRLTRADYLDRGDEAFDEAAGRAVAWAQNLTGLGWPG